MVKRSNPARSGVGDVGDQKEYPLSSEQATPFKGLPAVSMAVLQLLGEDIWYVEVKFADELSEQVGVFNTNAETKDWIIHKSSSWIQHYLCRTFSRHDK